MEARLFAAPGSNPPLAAAYPEHMKQNIEKILLSPIAEWRQILEASSRLDLQDIEESLSDRIHRQVLLHAYLAHRFNAVSGDRSHEESARHANRELVKICRAMGFSYPANVPLQFRNATMTKNNRRGSTRDTATVSAQPSNPHTFGAPDKQTRNKKPRGANSKAVKMLSRRFRELLLR